MFDFYNFYFNINIYKNKGVIYTENLIVIFYCITSERFTLLELDIRWPGSSVVQESSVS